MSKRRGCLFVAILFFCLLAAVIKANAGQVSLAWDPNMTPPDRYEIYAVKVSTGRNPLTVSFDYTKPAWSGTATTCTLSGLEDGQLYVFVCRAFVGDSQSGDSNRVVYETPQIRLRVG